MNCEKLLQESKKNVQCGRWWLEMKWCECDIQITKQHTAQKKSKINEVHFCCCCCCLWYCSFVHIFSLHQCFVDVLSFLVHAHTHQLSARVWKKFSVIYLPFHVSFLLLFYSFILAFSVSYKIHNFFLHFSLISYSYFIFQHTEERRHRDCIFFSFRFTPFIVPNDVRSPLCLHIFTVIFSFYLHLLEYVDIFFHWHSLFAGKFTEKKNKIKKYCDSIAFKRKKRPKSEKSVLRTANTLPLMHEVLGRRGWKYIACW